VSDGATRIVDVTSKRHSRAAHTGREE